MKSTYIFAEKERITIIYKGNSAHEKLRFRIFFIKDMEVLVEGPPKRDCRNSPQQREQLVSLHSDLAHLTMKTCRSSK